MKLYATCLLALISLTSFSQAHKTPLGKGFIEKTIEYYYSTQARQHGANAIFYIEKDSLTMNAKTDYGFFKVQFLTASEATDKLSQTAAKGAKIDRLGLKWITLDTIDVVITGCTVGIRKVKKVVGQKTVTTTERFLTNCTENFVDIPTCRFVYDPSTTAWIQLNRGKSVATK